MQPRFGKPVDPNTLSDDEVVRTARLVAASMIFGELIFAGVIALLYLTGAAPFSPDPALQRIMLLVATVFVITSFGSSFVIRRTIWSSKRDEATGGPTRAAYLQGSIIAQALNEGAGLFAIVMAMLFDPVFFVFVGVAIAAQAVLFPTRRGLRPNENPYRSDQPRP